MEKNLDEQSIPHEDEGNNTNIDDTSKSSLPETKDNVEDVKPDDETKKVDDVDHVEGEPKEEKKEEEEEESREGITVEVTQPETPPPNLEKVLEDIDRFLATTNENNNNNVNVNPNEEKIPECVDKFLDLLEEKIAKYDSGETKWGEVVEEDSSLLEGVNRVTKMMKLLSTMIIEFQSGEKETEAEGEAQAEEDAAEKENEKEKDEKKDQSTLVNRISAIQQRAMSYLEEEFRMLMEESRNQNKTENNDSSKGKQVATTEASENESTETVMDFPGFKEEVVTNLNKIACEMLLAGYDSECYHIYTVSRKHGFSDGLYKLGYERISMDEVQKMQWESLEREIPSWINTFKECATVWFPGERKLAASIFSDHPSDADTLYTELTRVVVFQLLNFAESVAMTKRAAEKLFKYLDMYEAIRDTITNLEKLYPENIVDDIKAEMTSAKNRLGEVAVLIFCELENSIKSDCGKTPVAGGAVHPLTRYIVNYLRLACEYKDTLEEVFREHSKIERSDSTSRPHYETDNQHSKEKENTSPFAAQLTRVMELLDANLEGKAKLYKEVPLSCIFMMNNGRYIVQKIKGSAEIYEVMGETWCRKRSTELRTYHKNYQVETWSKILTCLSPKGLSDNGKVPKPVLKERFKNFNTLFDEIHKTQSTWVVSDEQLQSELRVSISALVIPAYRSFLGRFSQYLDPGRQTEKYIKFQAEDIENYIDDLFAGNPHQAMVRKKV
ncbi:exocyst complex component 7-like protein [Trifolium pratense]|uniref:Exocyst subunit Exo70 family protein n=1 Tax=Trifolium pratense TaxID=57577 RepID=A0A2K3N012_TRIPR|nr:exocyst complex component 7-like protein [Trifolium pratense]